MDDGRGLGSAAAVPRGAIKVEMKREPVSIMQRLPVMQETCEIPSPVIGPAGRWITLNGAP